MGRTEYPLRIVPSFSPTRKVHGPHDMALRRFHSRLYVGFRDSCGGSSFACGPIPGRPAYSVGGKVPVSVLQTGYSAPLPRSEFERMNTYTYRKLTACGLITKPPADSVLERIISFEVHLIFLPKTHGPH